jgi:NAD(P)-dependent dehydrogenase (short-subunit alcohol dehydrogenase family)
MIVDMSLQSSIRSFAETFLSEYKKLDILIHNAAHFDIGQKKIVFTDEGIECVWATNHLGPVLLTELLLEPLKRSKQGRIITVSSKGLALYPFLKINISDPEFKYSRFNVQRAYYHSKLAQVMYTYWMAKRLKNTKITANSIRVTNVQIDVERYSVNLSRFLLALYSFKSRFSISPDKMAETYQYLALSDDLDGVSGKYFDSPDKIVKSSKYSYQRNSIEDLMKVTMDYLK